MERKTSLKRTVNEEVMHQGQAICPTSTNELDKENPANWQPRGVLSPPLKEMDMRASLAGATRQVSLSFGRGLS
jgi:hypothetical protein